MSSVQKRVTRGSSPIVLAVVVLIGCWGVELSAQDSPELGLSKSPAELVEAGESAYRAKDYTGAVLSFKKAIEADPDLYDAHYGLARTQEKQKDYEAASKTYEGMVERFADQDESHYRLGIVYRKMDRLDESAAAYRAFLQGHPDDPDPYYGLGTTLEQAGDKIGAMAAYERYAQLEQRPSEAEYVKKAEAKVAALKAEIEALRGAEMASEPQEVEPEEHPELEAEKSQEAVEVKVVEVVKPSAEVIAASDTPEADRLFWEGEYEAAKEAYLEHYTGKASSTTAYKLGVTYAAMGRYGAAIDAWELGLKLAPEAPIFVDAIARAKRRLAVDAVLDPSSLTGESAEQLELTQGYLNEGRYLMAVRSGALALEGAPEEPRAHHLMALAYLGLALPELALASLGRELALQPGDFALYHLLGQAHDKLGQNASSVYYYQLYLDAVDPDAEDAGLNGLRERVSNLEKLQSKE